MIFTFLNTTVVLSDRQKKRILQISAQPLLWQFHYCYHDYLIALRQKRDTSIDDDIERFIRQWIEDYPPNAREANMCAWHPYVISLRLESWLRLYSARVQVHNIKYDQFNDLLKAGICRMTYILRQNIEYGTMGNHLLKNIKALLLAGCTLSDSYGSTLCSKAMNMLRREIKEQILTDGMHFERSPMYHVVMTSDMLDMYIVLQYHNKDLAKQVGSIVKGMLSFLEELLHPDGQICLFNDSNFSASIKAKDVIELGKTTFGKIEKCSSTIKIADQNALEKQSGLVLVRSEKLYFAFDGGYIGPDYQPGHAHCDTLSYECSWMGRRIITDTGVYHYKESVEREYCRSTKAHNTICIDNQDQSEMWKNFRVGRRAKPLFLTVSNTNDHTIIQGAHNGYERFQKGLFHERAVFIAKDAFIIVYDIIHGYGRHRIENRIHFHPNVTVNMQEGKLFCVSNENAFAIMTESSHQSKVILTDYYPRFGVKQTRNTLTYEEEVSLPFQMAYAVVFNREIPEMEILRSGNLIVTQPTTGQYYELKSQLS